MLGKCLNFSVLLFLHLYMGKIVPITLSWLIHVKCFRAVPGPQMHKCWPLCLVSSCGICSPSGRCLSQLWAAHISTDLTLQQPRGNLNAWSIPTTLLSAALVPRVSVDTFRVEVEVRKRSPGPYQQLGVSRGVSRARWLG